MFEEIWRPIPDCPNYEASSHGRIRSDYSGKIMKAWKTKKGYLRVNFQPLRKKHFVHGCVLKAFRGFPPSDNHQCDHLNGLPSDNCIENLKWSTPDENNKRKNIHGTSLHGERNPISILKPTYIPIIFDRCANGETATSIAKSFGVVRETICLIICRKNWKHIDIAREKISTAQAALKRNIGGNRRSRCRHADYEKRAIQGELA